MDSKKYLEIYDYCQKQYDKLDKKDGRYNPKHDKIVMGMAAKEFRMSEENIRIAFDTAAHLMLKKMINNKLLKASPAGI